MYTKTLRRCTINLENFIRPAKSIKEVYRSISVDSQFYTCYCLYHSIRKICLYIFFEYCHHRRIISWVRYRDNILDRLTYISKILTSFCTCLICVRCCSSACYFYDSFGYDSFENKLICQLMYLTSYVCIHYHCYHWTIELYLVVMHQESHVLIWLSI